MAKTKPIKYIPKEGSIEQVVFPQEYFSGCDVKIKLNGVVLAEVSSISYKIQEQHKPIYGYGSREFNEMIKGNRLVTGQFIMPITEYNKLEEILKQLESQLQEMSGDMMQQVSNATMDSSVGQDNYPGWGENIDTSSDWEGDILDPTQPRETINNDKNQKEYLYITGRNTELRSMDSYMKGKALIKIKQNSKVEVISGGHSEYGKKVEGVFYYVKYNGRLGYVHSQNTTQFKPATNPNVGTR